MSTRRGSIPYNDLSIGQLDIHCGKFASSRRHVGNNRFNAIIALNTRRYHQAGNRRGIKTAIVKAVLHDIQSIGSRFFQRHGTEWIQVNNERIVLDKIGHCLRESCSSDAAIAWAKHFMDTNGFKYDNSSNHHDNNNYNNNSNNKDYDKDSNHVGTLAAVSDVDDDQMQEGDMLAAMTLIPSSVIPRTFLTDPSIVQLAIIPRQSQSEGIVSPMLEDDICWAAFDQETNLSLPLIGSSDAVPTVVQRQSASPILRDDNWLAALDQETSTSPPLRALHFDTTLYPLPSAIPAMNHRSWEEIPPSWLDQSVYSLQYLTLKRTDSLIDPGYTDDLDKPSRSIQRSVLQWHGNDLPQAIHDIVPPADDASEEEFLSQLDFLLSPDDPDDPSNPSNPDNPGNENDLDIIIDDLIEIPTNFWLERKIAWGNTDN